MPEVKVKKLVKVQFWDHAKLSGESSLRDVLVTRPIKVTVHGLLVREDDLSMTVLSHLEDPCGDNNVRTEHHAMVILKSCVIERVELEEKQHEGP